MKTHFTLKAFLITIVLGTQQIIAQDFEAIVTGGEFEFNTPALPCLTEAQRQNIKNELQVSINELAVQDRLAYSSNLLRGGSLLFDWPIRKAEDAIYNDVWAISGYVDHDETFPSQLTDYNCGTRTYDTADGYNHQGVDMFTWPFGWDMMDNDLAEIVAAADGQIIFKSDGEFDRSCNFNSNLWNAVYVQHIDGSIAWYGHMKNGSVTTKNVGDMVTVGEYLGVIGSSGNSTGPHLHFEIYENSSFTTLIDPYEGDCNTMNTGTRWMSQKPYNNPRVNALITHSSPPNFNTCPETETTFAETTFSADETIYFAVYLRDQEIGSTINLKVIKPDNTALYDWNFPFTNTFSASYYYWQFSNVFDQVGEWKWETTYLGETVTHSFNITDALSVDETLNNTVSVYPNPFTDDIHINSYESTTEITIMDLSGKLIAQEYNIKGIDKVNLSEVAAGIYFMQPVVNDRKLKPIKIIKN